MLNKLHFARGNAKLRSNTAVLSLPAGHACPFAKDCRSAADKETGKIKDGPHTQFRCYATTPEALFPAVRESRWHNFNLIRDAKTTDAITDLIDFSLRGKKVNLVRFHQSGDFFNQNYFDAWLRVACRYPDWTFYGYTKALPFWVARLGLIPSNFHLVASKGGTHDELIEKYHLRSAKVVYSVYQARKQHLPIDHDDTHVWKYAGDFAILIHGTQPPKSNAGKAWYRISHLNKNGGGYKSEYFGKNKAKKKAALLAPVISVKTASGFPVYA